MPLPVIEDVYRCAIDWSNVDGRTATNVLHVDAPGANEAAVAAQLANSFTADMWNTVGGTGLIQQLTVTKLDGTPDGRFYGRQALIDMGATELTLAGGGSEAYIPQASALIKETTGATGRSGRGRVFLPWLGETESVNGAIAPNTRDAATAAWVAFANDLVAETMALVIASYTHSTASQVLALFCESYSATQRRRNNTFR